MLRAIVSDGLEHRAGGDDSLDMKLMLDSKCTSL